MTLARSSAPSAASWRPAVRPLVLNLVVTAWLLATCNAAFWRRLAAVLGEDSLSLVTLGAAFSAWVFFFVSLLALRRAQKPVLALLVVLAAITSYYQDALGTFIDREMVQSVVETTVAEGSHLLTWQLLWHVSWRIAIGLLLVFGPRVRRQHVLRAAFGWLATGAATLGAIGVLLAPNYRSFTATLQDHRELVRSLQPLAPLHGTLSYAQMMLGARDLPLQPTGADAVPGPLLAAAKKPVVLIFVVGETSRAANWSLGGYARDTNPDLARHDIVFYPDVVSCGTGTAVSLPCMFSPLTRGEYSYRGGLSTENLLDVLRRAGFQIRWWDNQTGDKNVAARFHVRTMGAGDDAAACARGECLDDVFLPPLRRLLPRITQNTVLVLHQIGSHGPSYWLRYPPDEEQFRPACHTSELADCTQAQIVNAYDNTILHTDRFLAQVIDTLKAAPNIDSAMLYVSDHGESLGEGGFYLHSAPYRLAPAEQKHVPMVIWMAPDYRHALGLSAACLRHRAQQPASHDAIFSTVLGLLDVQTSARNPALDLTDGCRSMPIS